MSNSHAKTRLHGIYTSDVRPRYETALEVEGGNQKTYIAIMLFACFSSSHFMHRSPALNPFIIVNIAVFGALMAYNNVV